MENVFEYLRNARVFYLATIDGDTPRVRPMATLVIYDGKIYTIMTTNKKMYRQLLENSNVEVTAMFGQTWIRLSGKLILDDRKQTVIDLLEDNPQAKQTFGGNLEMVAPFYFKDVTATINSFTAKPITYTF